MIKQLLRICKLPSYQVLRAEQLEEAQRERLAWSTQREYASAMECMYCERIDRLKGEIDSERMPS